MLSNKVIIGSIASLGLVFGIAEGQTMAQMTHEIPTSETSQTTQFRRIEQPLWVKGAITAGGLALIGLELWWFLLSKLKSQKAEAHNGIQEVNITVDGGYEPSRIVVNGGQPVRLNFLRRDPSGCLEQVVFPDFHIAQELQLNQITPVEFIPQQPGQYTFACGMNMFRGVLEVKATG
ncbi:MAG: cupredoxin domain-containing protein [Fischerella sp.]|uniref:cupredoxin domain-containing protein n=1 Tax=Fischerella sp. TaxID=1191 RepID=UPI0017F54F54|nr:cupredoxin domain-containing protein [Fischerella sp.]NWF60334.1 cupredoxin domain-containing protein [Fischerella sp.]